MIKFNKNDFEKLIAYIDDRLGWAAQDDTSGCYELRRIKIKLLELQKEKLEEEVSHIYQQVNK